MEAAGKRIARNDPRFGIRPRDRQCRGPKAKVTLLGFCYHFFKSL